MAYEELEPFGEERADLRAGIIAALIANIHRDRQMRPKAYVPLDFMPLCKKEESKAEQTPKDQVLIAEILTLACEAKENARNKRTPGTRRTRKKAQTS